jgi:hypothetical protein
MRRRGRLYLNESAIHLCSFVHSRARASRDLRVFLPRLCSRARVVFSCNFIGQGNTRVRRTTTSQPVSLQYDSTSAGGTAVTSQRRVAGHLRDTTRGVTQKMSYYSNGGITAAMAQVACTSFRGTWALAK